MGEDVRRLVARQVDKAAEKLRAARTLLASGHWDDAISRAYYAVFHAASAALLFRGVTAKTHEGLKTLFSLHLIRTGLVEKEYGETIRELKDDRENGDYDVFTSFGREDAEKAVQDAERFLSRIEVLLEDSRGL